MKIEFNDLEEFSAFCFDLEAKKDDWFTQGFENGVSNSQEEIEQLKKKIAELKNKRKGESQ